MKLPATGLNYIGLVRFLVQPFLESPESLSVDCEMSYSLKRAWIRIAFSPTDREKVFGRRGRNIQAIHTVIAAAAELAGQSVYLDIYENNIQNWDSMPFDKEQEERTLPSKSRERRSGSLPRPVAKPRLR